MKNKKLVSGILALIILISGIVVYVYWRNWEKQEPEMGIEWFQTGNTLPTTQLQPKQSRELTNNRIGGAWDLVSPDYYGEPDEFIHGVSKVGLKWIRLSLDHGTWDMVDWSKGEYSKYYVEPHQNKTITGLADNDIKMMYCLVFWDVESPGKEVEEGYSRFKTEDEIQRYLDYVQFIVRNFKNRVFCINLF